jgi:hypothetical protein
MKPNRLPALARLTTAGSGVVRHCPSARGPQRRSDFDTDDVPAVTKRPVAYAFGVSEKTTNLCAE